MTRTVLYIEDNPLNVKLVGRILARRPGVSLLVATLGASGAQLAHEHLPVLVILDLNLPDIAGDEVLRRIRNEPRTAGTPVIVASGGATPEQMALLREAGADGYLPKPFEIEEFLAIVDHFALGDTAGPARGA